MGCVIPCPANLETIGAGTPRSAKPTALKLLRDDSSKAVSKGEGARLATAELVRPRRRVGRELRARDGAPEREDMRDSFDSVKAAKVMSI